LNIKIKNKMTLKKLNDINELVNVLNTYNSLKNEITNELPELLTTKKRELVSLINKMKSYEAFKQEASQEEKTEIENLLKEIQD